MYLKLGLREKRCLYEVMDAAGCFLGYSASSIRQCLITSPTESIPALGTAGTAAAF